MSNLFSPVKVGRYKLEHRVVMAPLTRMRSNEGDVPSDLMVEYYTQRATKGGLIISEATPVAQEGYGYAGAPGAYHDRQIEGWKRVTDAVHAKGGRIFLQLWHVGRQSHVDLQPDGGAPVAPSAIRAEGHAYTKNGAVEFSMPRALELNEIPGIVEQFRLGSERALKAGFDGVEIHGANGYLPDQFLQDGTNKRTDTYGGKIENRALFMLEVTDAAIGVFGADRVAVRLAPSGTYGSMFDSDPATTFGYITERLSERGIGYLHIVEPRIMGADDIEAGHEAIDAAYLRPKFKGTLIAAGGFTRQTAEEIVAAGHADMVAFGRHFISNPDLVERIRRNLPLNCYDRDTIDYPAHSAENAAV
jgi:N-ethylmaleimide reductase